MVESNSLSALELRRRLLLAESELNRLTLRQGFADLQDQTRWVSDLRSGGSSSSNGWLTLAAPAAGLLAAGALLKRGTLFGRISGLLKLAAVAYPVVRAWHQKRQKPASAS